ncbi:hypothetical protein BC938DRAFT_470874 [Jimgerdemannia flammicorona]|uniref:Uncharacterized protein n=1 Tax=Jimgerdemannia flammicorona TaxID=994334 RepID=A0A433Q993_9FUNG|nr:hypothetical protein BC938DRAFT_470874 [Jimgerdemannia flammicorona]
MDGDKILALDNGRVAEFDTLLADEITKFSSTEVIPESRIHTRVHGGDDVAEVWKKAVQSRSCKSHSETRTSIGIDLGGIPVSDNRVEYSSPTCGSSPMFV